MAYEDIAEDADPYADEKFLMESEILDIIKENPDADKHELLVRVWQNGYWHGLGVG